MITYSDNPTSLSNKLSPTNIMPTVLSLPSSDDSTVHHRYGIRYRLHRVLSSTPIPTDRRVGKEVVFLTGGDTKVGKKTFTYKNEHGNQVTHDSGLLHIDANRRSYKNYLSAMKTGAICPLVCCRPNCGDGFMFVGICMATNQDVGGTIDNPKLVLSVVAYPFRGIAPGTCVGKKFTIDSNTKAIVPSLATKFNFTKLSNNYTGIASFV